MSFFEQYLTELRDLRSTGATVKETSYYPALAALLNAVGAGLKPSVRCVVQVASTGAGIPDLGLFAADQFEKKAAHEPRPGQLPARGVVEAKGVADDVEAVAKSEQVKKYLGRYGAVLVTNYRDFLLVVRDRAGRPVPAERCTLAASAADFWRQAQNPKLLAAAHEVPLTEMLARVLLATAPVTQPRDVAWFLASYARVARFQIGHSSLAELDSLRLALEEALGVKFKDAKGAHFFQSTLIQTLFYGVFSAWVLWHRERGPVNPDDRFDWRTSAFTLQVPVIGGLFHQLSNPRRLKPLGLDLILDRTAGVLNRVDRAAFFGAFDAGDAVQYFYEPFLEAFDPELRKELGVWYTPREIVQYQVERVDRVLREELKIADGLADPSVYVLDPCCGTGAYLVEVLHRIERTLQAKGDAALVASDLKQAAAGRVFGFELLPAPFVVAHLQVGLHLNRAGAAFADTERAGVYLTNTLTGWEPPDEAIKKRLRQLALDFPELGGERDAADAVKRGKRILVVLGNPPYNGNAGTATEEEGGIVEVYKGAYTDAQGKRRYRLNDPASRGGSGIKKFNLDDLYVRFFRIAERCIAEMNGTGVVSFISNNSWVSEPSFVLLRERLHGAFDRIWIENMHGNRKISEYAPDGRVSETVFAIPGFSPGIKQGTVISTWVRRKGHHPGCEVFYRDDLDEAKAPERRAHLLRTLTEKNPQKNYHRARPSPANRYSFAPMRVSAAYQAWPTLPELALKPAYNGPVERRGSALISLQREPLVERMRAYLDASVSDEDVAALHASLLMTGNRIEGPKARRKIQAEHKFDETKVVRYPVRPFDFRWCYLDNLRPLFSEPSPDLLAMRSLGVPQGFLISRDTADKDPEGPPFYFSRFVCDYDSISGHARHFPLWVRNGTLKKKVDEKVMWLLQEAAPGEADGRTLANLSPRTRAYLLGLGLPDPDAAGNDSVAGLVWLHALAIGFSPAYLAENCDGVRQGWPRVPLPSSLGTLEDSAALGWQIAELLETECSVTGVTSGTLRPELKGVGALAKKNQDGEFAAHTQIDPAADLKVTAGWSHLDNLGRVTPGAGAVAEHAAEKPAPWAATLDVFLNDSVAWRGVPKEAWEFYLGGYQVLKKWLSYREHGPAEKPVLGRALTKEEARAFTDIARRVSALVLLQPALDQNYRAVSAATHVWPSGGV
ncbi:MAG: N-6 DNA methylase [Opitutae bacterium]|nr:N-6 DNA methylase [Opitutae bacterium]